MILRFCLSVFLLGVGMFAVTLSCLLISRHYDQQMEKREKALDKSSIRK